jgi:O-antigen/teichoic acid export membrane protein
VLLAGNVGYALAQFGVLVVLARGTSPAQVGQYALALAITAPVQIGLGLRLRTVLAVDSSRTPFRTYFRLALSLAVAAVVVATAVGLVAAPGLALVVALVAASKGVESLIDVCYGEDQRHDRLHAVAASQLVRAAMTVAAAALGVHLAGLLGALVAILLVWLGQLLVLDQRRARTDPVAGGHRSPPVTPGWLVRHSWPLGIGGAVVSLSVALPRFVIADLLDAASLGLFAVLSYPTTAVSLFANSLGQAQVRAMAAAAEGRDFRRLSSLVLRAAAATVAVGVLGAVAVLLLGSAGIAWLLGPSYARDVPLLVLLVLVATLSGVATVSYYLLVSSGRFGLQPVVVLATLVVAAPAIHLATARWGLTGTAVALAAMYLLQTLLTIAAALSNLARARPRTAADTTRETR